MSRKAQFFRERLATAGIVLEIPVLDEGDFEHLTVSRQLDLVTRILDGQPATLIGSSLGGYVAALYASQHPEIFRMVLLAPAFGFNSRWADTFGPEKLAAWRSTGAAEVYHYATRDMRRISSELLYDAERHAGYPPCRQPALIFHGINDQVVPLSASRRWAEENPQARVVALESDHELLNALEEVWQGCKEFLI